MTSLDRRHFLGTSLGASLGAFLAPLALPRWLRAAAARLPEGQRRLVVIELSGGNDGLNTLVPVEDALYHRARPTIGLRPDEVLRVDELNGLHPSLEFSRKRLAAGQLAIVRDVGYPQPDLSHFTSQDVWATGSVDPTGADAGWLGRWAEGQGAEREEEGELLALALGDSRAPRVLRGARYLPPAVPELERFRFEAGAGDEGRARLRAFAALCADGEDDPALEHVRSALTLARFTSRRLAGAVRTRRGAEYPDNDLARDLAGVADTIAAGLPTRVFHVRLAGFDTHARQRKMQAILLHYLDRSLDAFLRDLESLGRLDDTLVVTTSEFGRRVAESGVGEEAGSDHGAASVQLLAGGAVRGGLHGEQPDLADLDEAGNLRFRVDFRSVLATLLESWLGADSAAVLGRSWPRLPILETL